MAARWTDPGASARSAPRWACHICNNFLDRLVMTLAELNRQRRLCRMRRGVVTAGQLHDEQCSASSKAAMITLTYRQDVEWRREHISLCLKAWRHELRGRKFRYVWVLELTKAGKPHYHVLVWLPPGRKLEMPDCSGAWPHGMSRVEWARNAVGYLVKYATKGCDGLKFPRGARLFGVGGLDQQARLRLRWAVLPKYVQEQCEPEDRVTRMGGGGWLAETTGEWMEAAALAMPEQGPVEIVRYTASQEVVFFGG